MVAYVVCCRYLEMARANYSLNGMEKISVEVKLVGPLKSLVMKFAAELYRLYFRNSLHIVRGKAMDRREVESVPNDGQLAPLRNRWNIFTQNRSRAVHMKKHYPGTTRVLIKWLEMYYSVFLNYKGKHKPANPPATTFPTKDHY